MDDDWFRIYNDEESKKLKSDMKNILENINSLVNKFMKSYDSNSKLQKEIKEMIYEGKLFHNKKKLQTFNGIVKNASEVVNQEEIEAAKEKCVMRQKRAEEMNVAKEFVQTAYLKALPQEQEKGKKALHFKEESIHETENKGRNSKSNQNKNDVVIIPNENNNNSSSGGNKNILFKPKFNDSDDEEFKNNKSKAVGDCYINKFLNKQGENTTSNSNGENNFSASKPANKSSSKNDDDDIKIEFLGKKHKIQHNNNFNSSDTANNNINKNNNKKQKKETIIIDPYDKTNSNAIGSKVIRSEIVFQSCYICKAKFNTLNIHSYYTNLCKSCGDFNYSFRTLEMDLTGRIAVVTGGRVKIGFYIVLKLLSYGCTVIATSRFPKDSLLKFKQEPDYEEFKDRLVIYPIDFRIFESTERFIQYLSETYPHIDILINNAAQTVRRSTSYYRYLLQIESAPLAQEEESKIIKNDFVYVPENMLGDGSAGAIPDAAALQTLFNTSSAKSKKNSISNIKIKNDKNLPLSVIASQIKFINEKGGPAAKTIMGGDGQPIDFSQEKSSWNMELDEIPFQEFTEVQIINAWTPYYLCVKLKPLMEKSPFPDRYIINVSSVEGIFNHFKRTTHPHTNMAKAALNMMTRTCGKYYKQSGIYMTGVDTGWVSPMNEFTHLYDKNNAKAFEKEYVNIPLDELDGAMRCIHPVIEGVMKKNFIYGHLLKDYKITNW